MKTLRLPLMVVCTLSLAACGGSDSSPEAAPVETETAGKPGEVHAMATCYAYLLDSANFSPPTLNPWPVTGVVGQCINLPAASDNLTTSFRLANCGVIFFDGANCTGASFAAPTSANMPLAFDNLTTSLRFY
ncbi:hypothetical protein [Vitiosangium sp. GDMCC 1.1324]|uniref:hypothetical protein n=1 Tax=Vitiosangium sp. (strain GDMCC 1.1324) TaxID=2138576 RepID=UPI000D378840|nr:hypothetical protein [Vitiosangium sp. GDMCC 1.1324]PTL75825.1 hypothetical protein DAT35_53260 [Vitiosangium sp. GDMCC 1.1324]